ncbi:MAG: RNA polymerase sigma factor [Bryobacteraceae bacterium]
MSEIPIVSDAMTAGPVPLETLMVRYQQADANATEKLLNLLWPLLNRFFLSMPDSRPSAEDLAQETLLQIHKARRTYRSGEPVLPWVYAIARHVRVDHFRRQRRRAAHEEAFEERELEQKAPPSEARHDEATGDLEKLLAAVPESQREVLTMLKVLGMTVEEVARTTSSTTGAVKQKAHRAYETLRKLLENRPPGSRRVTAVKG